MRLIFFGSGEFGVPTAELLRGRHDLALVVSQPDRPAGRGRKSTPTPVATWAESKGLVALRVEDVNHPTVIERLREARADAAVVIAFGQKLSPEVIAASGRLVVNLHASLLPRYRGAAPINWAILNGETQTGVSVISLAQKMDGGLVYAQASTPIDPLETAGELHDRLAKMGPKVIAKVLDEFAAGTLRGVAQDERHATRAPKLSKADSHVSFMETAEHFCHRVHGLTPWPGAKVRWVSKSPTHKEQEIILLRVRAEPDMTLEAPPGTVLDEHARVAVRDGVVQLLEMQVPGGKPLKAAEFLRGHRLAPSDVLHGAPGVIP